MYSSHIHGLWQQFLGTVQEHWASLAGDKLRAEAGARNRHRGRVRVQSAVEMEITDRQLEDFHRRNRHWQDLSTR